MKTMMKSINVGPIIMLLLTVGCGGDDGDDDAAIGVGTGGEPEIINGLPKPAAFGKGPATILEGTWTLNCTVSNISSSIYLKGVVVYTGNGRSVTSASYAASDCNSDSIISGIGTSQGSIVIGNPIISETGLEAFEFDLSSAGRGTYYSIARVADNTLYIGRVNIPFTAPDPRPGSTAGSRTKSLDFTYFYTRHQ